MRTETNSWRNQDVVVVHDVLEAIHEAIVNREYALDDPNEVRLLKTRLYSLQIAY